MEASKERCGKVPLDTLVTGEITARRASVSNFIKMAISMKACGPWTRSMVREPSGEMIAVS
jgi:hypothetical protein